jgi:hypothetical protein
MLWLVLTQQSVSWMQNYRWLNSILIGWICHPRNNITYLNMILKEFNISVNQCLNRTVVSRRRRRKEELDHGIFSSRKNLGTLSEPFLWKCKITTFYFFSPPSLVKLYHSCDSSYVSSKWLCIAVASCYTFNSRAKFRIPRQHWIIKLPK